MPRRRQRIFSKEFRARFDLIAEHPEIGRPREELGRGLRSIVHARYIIFYRRVGDHIEIVRIMHGHRDFRGGLH